MPSPAGCSGLCRLGAFGLIAIAQIYEKIVAPGENMAYRTRTSCELPGCLGSTRIDSQGSRGRHYVTGEWMEPYLLSRTSFPVATDQFGD